MDYITKEDYINLREYVKNRSKDHEYKTFLTYEEVKDICNYYLQHKMSGLRKVVSRVISRLENESIIDDRIKEEFRASTENNISESSAEQKETSEYIVEDEIRSDDSEMEPLEFIKQNVDQNTTEEDLDDYYDYLSSITKMKIVNKNSNILNPNNENALLAAIAFGFNFCKNPKDLDSWLQRFSITHKSFVEKTQKEIYTEMVSSLKRFCGMVQKVGVA